MRDQVREAFRTRMRFTGELLKVEDAEERTQPLAEA